MRLKINSFFTLICLFILVSNNRYFQKVTEKGRTVFCLVGIYIKRHGIEQVWQGVGKYHMNKRQRVGKYHE